MKITTLLVLTFAVVLGFALTGHQTPAKQVSPPAGAQSSAVVAPAAPEPTHQAVRHAPSRPAQTVARPASTTTHTADCPGADYVCGTCPNGDTWSYLNDGSPEAAWARQDTIIFNTWNPCG